MRVKFNGLVQLLYGRIRVVLPQVERRQVIARPDELGIDLNSAFQVAHGFLCPVLTERFFGLLLFF